MLDRNGLRPSRYLVTKDGLVVMASEAGVLDIPPDQVEYKGRLQPGRMFFVDTVEGRIVQDEEIKQGFAAAPAVPKVAGREPGRSRRTADTAVVSADQWLRTARPAEAATGLRLHASKSCKMILAPMAANGQEPVGSMGTDTPLAVLSDKSPLLFQYFKQLFAQVTNPPVDPIREEMVMSAETTIGCEQNLFEETPLHCRQLRLKKSDPE